MPPGRNRACHDHGTGQSLEQGGSDGVLQLALGLLEGDALLPGRYALRSALDRGGLSQTGTSMRAANATSIPNASKVHVINGRACRTLIIGQLLKILLPAANLSRWTPGEGRIAAFGSYVPAGGSAASTTA